MMISKWHEHYLMNNTQQQNNSIILENKFNSRMKIWMFLFEIYSKLVQIVDHHSMLYEENDELFDHSFSIDII